MVAQGDCDTFFDEIGGKRTYERVKQFADDEHEPPSKATKVALPIAVGSGCGSTPAVRRQNAA